MRNSVGLKFHPLTNELWFTDNGRDGLANVNGSWDNQPDDELNKVSFIGEDFGFPHCHSLGSGLPQRRDIGNVRLILDDQYPPSNDICDENVYTKALQALGPHMGALGMRFTFGKYNDLDMFNLPTPYNHSILIASHGSWDRTEKIGYRVSIVYLDGNNYDEIVDHDAFAFGWLVDDEQTQYGRPSDVDVLPDGSIIVSDDEGSTIYRIYYDQ